MARLPEPVEIVVGGLYASRQTDGTYRIVKVLVADEHAAHLRMYAERYDALPRKVESRSLSLGRIQDGLFGIGHFPIARQGFFNSEKHHIGTEPVTEDELEGYRIWLGEPDDA